MRIVLLGKTGSGKSSLANTIFGERHIFEINNSPFSTRTCQSETRTVNGRKITLVDTPGFFGDDSNRTEQSSETLRCMTECNPGPHAFLLVLKVERYTKQEEEVVNEILKYFCEEALKYTTVVFTHGDQLKGQRIKEWVNENEVLTTLVDKCGGRCHVFDNNYWNNQVQVEELLETIDNTVTENGGGYYTNEFLQNFQLFLARLQEGNIPVWILIGALLGVAVVGGLMVTGLVPFSFGSLVQGAGAGAVMGGAVGLLTTPSEAKKEAQQLKKYS